MRCAVVVSGAPGAGKTTLAIPLAEALAMPLLSKDMIKERLYDSLPVPAATEALAWSRTLGGAAMDLLWTLATVSPQVVLEANFRPHSEYELDRLRGLQRPIVEVHCACLADLASRRYAERSQLPGRHLGAHPMMTLTQEFQAQFDRPLGLGEVLVVDTAGPVDLGGVVDDVTRLIQVASSDGITDLERERA